MTDPVTLLGLLAEEDRIRVLAAVVLGARRTEDVADYAGLDPRTAARALARLRVGGLLEDGPNGWTARVDVLKDAARAAAPPPARDDHGVRDAAGAAVLRAFLRDGRLTGIPSSRQKRLVVLDHLARVFEPGVRYSEREVNAALRAFHDDVAALRRYLVDEGFLTREGGAGEYWRSGGTVDL